MSCEPTQDPPFESAVWAAGDTADPQAQASVQEQVQRELGQDFQ